MINPTCMPCVLEPGPLWWVSHAHHKQVLPFPSGVHTRLDDNHNITDTVWQAWKIYDGYDNLSTSLEVTVSASFGVGCPGFRSCLARFLLFPSLA